jgi:small ligand-binding sensory domain FIST
VKQGAYELLTARANAPRLVRVEGRTATSRIVTGLSTAHAAEDAAVEAVLQVRSALEGDAPELAYLFLSPSHVGEVELAAAIVREQLRPASLLGCVAEGVVGGTRELEDGPGVALWAGALPGARVETFHLEAVAAGDGLVVSGFPELDEEPTLVTMLVDPFTFPAGSFLRLLNEEHAGLPLVGGIAAGAGSPGAQVLIVDDTAHANGVVGAAVSGVPVRTIVSQGCAPIGRDAVVTHAEGNVVFELAGEPALQRLKADLASLPPERLRQAASGLLVGLVIDENRAEYGRGDYLVRALLGADEETGAIAVGDEVRIGQTLRFHVRDAASADEDLRESLAGGLAGETATGALLFTCNGRGTHMFSEPDHDARAVAEAVGSPALAGFFCGGEIGPVGGRAFLHGFTATAAVFLA